jgi:hypothetical protein
MSVNAENMYRFACPACKRILKAPLSWAGRRGFCPKCNKALHFPRKTALFSAQEEGAQTLLKLVSESAAPLDENDADRLSLLMSQGSCLDYSMAQRFLAGRQLPARQWRKLLPVAGTREAMRLQLAEAVERATTETDSPSDDLAIALPPDESADQFALAWEIMVRFQDHIRHGTCQGCKDDPSGMRCIYQSFESFAETRNFDSEDCRRWAKLCRQIFGLVGSTEPRTTSAAGV